MGSENSTLTILIIFHNANCYNFHYDGVGVGSWWFSIFKNFEVQTSLSLYPRRSPFTTWNLKEEEIEIASWQKQIKKTYNNRDSLVVTHPTTSRSIWGLIKAERTGYHVFLSLWSYVLEEQVLLILKVSHWYLEHPLIQKLARILLKFEKLYCYNHTSWKKEFWMGEWPYFLEVLMIKLWTRKRKIMIALCFHFQKFTLEKKG